MPNEHSFCRILLRVASQDAVHTKAMTRKQIRDLDVNDVSMSKTNRSFTVHLRDEKFSWHGHADCSWHARAQAIQKYVEQKVGVNE